MLFLTLSVTASEELRIEYFASPLSSAVPTAFFASTLSFSRALQRRLPIHLCSFPVFRAHPRSIVLKSQKSRCSSGFSHIKKQSRLFAGLLFAFFALNYSVLSAATGSRFAAPFAGISPPISVSTTLSTTSITAPPTGSTALTSIEPVRL